MHLLDCFECFVDEHLAKAQFRRAESQSQDVVTGAQVADRRSIRAQDAGNLDPTSSTFPEGGTGDQCVDLVGRHMLL